MLYWPNLPRQAQKGAVPLKQTQPSEAGIAALATSLIMQSHGAVVPQADVNELERVVGELLQATRTLRRYPLRNSDEPLTVNGRGPGERA